MTADRAQRAWIRERVEYLAPFSTVFAQELEQYMIETIEKAGLLDSICSVYDPHRLHVLAAASAGTGLITAGLHDFPDVIGREQFDAAFDTGRQRVGASAASEKHTNAIRQSFNRYYEQYVAGIVSDRFMDALEDFMRFAARAYARGDDARKAVTVWLFKNIAPTLPADLPPALVDKIFIPVAEAILREFRTYWEQPPDTLSDAR